MAFLKRSLARLDLLFKPKKPESRTKFYECVEKVIEARRSGCIDEDGNIVKPLDDLLKKNEEKEREMEREAVHEDSIKEIPAQDDYHEYELPPGIPGRIPNYRVSIVEPRPRPRARLIKGVPPTYVRPDKLREQKEKEVRRREANQPQNKQPYLRTRQKQARRVSPVIVDGKITPSLIRPLNSSEEEMDDEMAMVIHRINPRMGRKSDRRSDRRIERRITAVSNPTYRESFPLPEEDDGSEGYASASEVDHFEFNPTAFLERNRTSGNPLHHHVHRRHGHSSVLSEHSSDECGDDFEESAASRRVRFSDDVQEIENFLPSSGDDSTLTGGVVPDPIALPVHTKIDLFEKVSTCYAKATAVAPIPPQPLMNRHSDPGPRIPPRPVLSRLQSTVTKEKVVIFEELSNPHHRPVPPPRPRRRKLENKMNETKKKINFFEELSKGAPCPASPPLNHRASTPNL